MADAHPCGEVEDDVSMLSAPAAEADAEHRRTDHERQEGTPNDSPPTDTLPPPPPRLYKLRTKPIAPARPHPSQNLIDLYSLQGVQASVARHDAAGNKINKLRKSYEGKVKQLGLSGRSKAQMGNGALAGLIVPEWDYDVGEGKTLWEQDRGAEFPLGDPDTEQEILGKLSSALAMRPGHFPRSEHEQWKNVLGLDEPKGTPVVAATKPYGLLTAVNPALAKTAPGIRHSAPASPGEGLGGAARPERAGKKHRYDEASYSGYHEGYDDDGYSTGGDLASRRGSASKRQKTGGSGGGGGGGGGNGPAAPARKTNDFWALRRASLHLKIKMAARLDGKAAIPEQGRRRKFVLKLKATPGYKSEAKLGLRTMLDRLSSLSMDLKSMHAVLLGFSSPTAFTTKTTASRKKLQLAATAPKLRPGLLEMQNLLGRLSILLDADSEADSCVLVDESIDMVAAILRVVYAAGA
ncbi:hypothetical protein LTR91_025276 [Friedmanniomyces endolithicus]|uniref:Mediator of RNA polymerase II transcription subunit 19 n=1 Tax=Friedmanniomyces endolithicus TaxID=329885 RepID=A0AAN6H5D7_9PEZI|nr:hypothetical protein LTR91_025276 [Friedmanniomyces endolithicus]KAK0954448.1 hypothetical protein LTS01_023899 [Friedmanniomyces endolithicus]